MQAVSFSAFCLIRTLYILRALCNSYTREDPDKIALMALRCPNVLEDAFTRGPAEILTFTTLWAYLADDKWMIVFLFFPENRI